MVPESEDVLWMNRMDEEEDEAGPSFRAGCWVSQGTTAWVVLVKTSWERWTDRHWDGADLGQSARPCPPCHQSQQQEGWGSCTCWTQRDGASVREGEAGFQRTSPSGPCGSRWHPCRHTGVCDNSRPVPDSPGWRCGCVALRLSSQWVYGRGFKALLFYFCCFLILWLWILVLGGGMFPLKGDLSMSGGIFWWIWIGGLLLIPPGEKLQRFQTILQWPRQQFRRERSISGFFLMQLTASLRCRIHRPFRVCISVLFSVFTDMCNDHQF